jgi:hypothetical protein
VCFLQLILRVWRPIPPSDDYVALGFVGSATPAAPPAVAAESLRCVHRSLVVTDASVPEMTVTSTATGEPPKPLWRYRGRNFGGGGGGGGGSGAKKMEGEGAPASFWLTAEGQSTFTMTSGEAPDPVEWPRLRMGELPHHHVGNADMQLLTLLDAPNRRRQAYGELLPALLECTPATSQWAAERGVLLDMERAANRPCSPKYKKAGALLGSLVVRKAPRLNECPCYLMRLI